MRKLVLAGVGCLFLLGARHRAVPPAPPAEPRSINIDISRSLVITDPAILDGFDFQRVLQALINRSSATATTPLELYRQWFDTQNPKPGLAVFNAPHCDDFTTNGKPSFNGFPRRCPTPEGALATTDPFAAYDYKPIGMTNRFDLTPVDSANCGQYRIVYAKTTIKLGEKVHIIFEGVLPNPNRGVGVAGCRPVAEFWADLSNVDSITERRARLERFFYDGIDGFAPLLHSDHFTVESTGRIRTSQTSSGDDTRFYQFHLQESDARLLVVPGMLENMPYGSLYNAAAPTVLGAEFRQFFISQVATLAIPGVNRFFDRIPGKYLMTESHPENLPLAFDTENAAYRGATTAEGQAFMAAISAELHRVGSSITVSDVLVRADLQNCHGCHRGGSSIGDGISFPTSFRASHIDEHPSASGSGATISPALHEVFAPNRAKILRDFLAGTPLPVHSNGGTLGGGRTSD